MCYGSFHNFRPILGRINFNSAFLETDPESFIDNIYTTLHEMMHVMGFSSEHYDRFVDKDGF